MGIYFSSLFGSWFSPAKAKLSMMGLDGAGKTTVLYKLKLNEVVTTIPTIGFNVEQVNFRNLEMTIWDIGGQKTIRNLWRHYLANNDGLIYLLDCSDRERFEDAKEELWNILNDAETTGAPLLLFANKQDLPQAASATEIIEKLDLMALRNRQWYVQATCATTGEGLVEGLSWLADQVKKKGSK